MGARYDRMGARTVAHRGAGEHPDLVLGPALELVKHDLGHVQGQGGRLVVIAAHLHEQYLIVYDATVGALRGRRQPAKRYSCRAVGNGRDIAWRCTWY